MLLLIWLECRVSEGSIDELPWAPHAWSLLDLIEFGRAHPYFILTIWFQNEQSKVLLFVAIM
jgi:hypothetical protein